MKSLRSLIIISIVSYVAKKIIKKVDKSHNNGVTPLEV